MKSPAGKLPASAVLLLALSPLAAFAQNIASQPGSVNRSLDLLPGPYLLSPARGAALPTPAVKVDALSFRFEPTTTTVKSAAGAPRLIRAGTGTLTLGSAENHFQPPPHLRAGAPPLHPATLRFEFALQAITIALPTDGKLTLKRD